MRYQLSFCEIEQLSDSIFEVTTAEGAVIDDKCAKEANDFWLKLRKEPFCLLVNTINSFSFSFTGSIEIGKNPLRKKTAGFSEETHCFHDRTETVKWLHIV